MRYKFLKICSKFSTNCSLFPTEVGNKKESTTSQKFAQSLSHNQEKSSS